MDFPLALRRLFRKIFREGLDTKWCNMAQPRDLMLTISASVAALNCACPGFIALAVFCAASAIDLPKRNQCLQEWSDLAELKGSDTLPLITDFGLDLGLNGSKGLKLKMLQGEHSHMKFLFCGGPGAIQTFLVEAAVNRIAFTTGTNQKRLIWIPNTHSLGCAVLIPREVQQVRCRISRACQHCCFLARVPPVCAAVAGVQLSGISGSCSFIADFGVTWTAESNKRKVPLLHM